MSVQSEIDRIEAARDDIAEAIREQDVTVPAGTQLAALADLVRQIVGKVRTVCGKGPDSVGNIALTAADVGARTWTIVVPSTAWTANSGGGYKATISCEGIATSTQLISAVLSPAYMGLADSEAAAAQWTYIDTAANSVTLYADIKPSAYFGLVLAALA